ncbi:MAG: putative DNA modification/repair radical SAM protein [Candidatus Borkfalkiaceae bacterium]|nr:putative DNA modification/repair radical SAM protein [Clostridia bacterium]MDY6224112.1 putative DNA modification/repair radical SAM protein [Christensenellaceae bacterium]
MIDEERLRILTEGTKYDVSCSSSGSRRSNASGGTGNAAIGGICHSFTADGRCLSLLKILMTNDCAFDCRYCPNRRSADVPRAVLSPEEICELTLDFYRRNYIEGLFLSSAVYKTPDYTMELLVQTAELLRGRYRFNGYLHIKGIPHADPLLTDRAALLADRMSYNLELPGEDSLKRLAPQKTKQSLLAPMKQLAEGKKAFLSERTASLKGAAFKRLSGEKNEGGIGENNRKIMGIAANGAEQTAAEKRLVSFASSPSAALSSFRANKRPLYLPAGQTTQIIVGASPEKDGRILRLSRALYQKFSMKRVYFSAYLPVVADPLLPDVGEKLLREHRLYQADWLMRFYGFSPEELADEDENLPVEYDPKCAWAIKHLNLFPVEINRADLSSLLRVPGIGIRSANKIIAARRHTELQYEHLKKMRVVLKRARHFITCDGKFYGEEKEEKIKATLSAAETSDGAEQLSLFSDAALIKSAAQRNDFSGETANLYGGYFTGARLDLPADETQKKINLSTPEIRRSVLTGEI